MRPKYRFTICYRNIAGSPRETEIVADTVIDAINQFNTTPATSGFDTPCRVEARRLRVTQLGVKPEPIECTFYLSGRYATPTIIDSPQP